ncbi:MAG: hypothetical protein AAFV07_02065 [Bacteroidota bacterium]
MKLSGTYLAGALYSIVVLICTMITADACNCPPDSLEHHFKQSEPCRLSTIECVLQADEKQQKKLARRLIRMIRQEAIGDTIGGTTAWILGEMQLQKAIKPLIKRLGADWFRLQTDVPYRMIAPAEALIQIGESCLPRLMRSARKTTDEQIHFQMAGIVFHVTGGKQPGLAYLASMQNQLGQRHQAGLRTIKQLLTEKFRD